MDETLKIKTYDQATDRRVKMIIDFDGKCDDKVFSDLYLDLNEDEELNSPTEGESEKSLFIQVGNDGVCNLNGIIISKRQKKALIDFLTQYD